MRKLTEPMVKQL